MVVNNSLDQYKPIIAALLSDAQTLHSEVFTLRAKRLTLSKMFRRMDLEGISFLTKALPRLGKSLDKALSGIHKFDCTGFRKDTGSQLPRFLGELFGQVFHASGWLRPAPCVRSIATLRQILFMFYKLELPYDESVEEKTIAQFVKTEQEISQYNALFSLIAEEIGPSSTIFSRIRPDYMSLVIRRARRLLFEVFKGFDPYAITPRHGPGAVSTREKLWDKFRFSRYNKRLCAEYPFDAYFKASLGHVCDTYLLDQELPESEASARVVLVPKDSRGPRLISCEPLEFQWIQQGIMEAIVRHIEHHPLSRENVRFTDQTVNQHGAYLGSMNGNYATLDLKDASDRVTVGLVKLLFPEPLLRCLLATRSDSTTLPDKSKITLNKFAPMGSALCFPILAMTVWALLDSCTEDADARESIKVYGDDVIVKTTQVECAIRTLESFGLLVNRDKSFYTGFFRESCGVDAYQGINVTPVRLKTVWSRHPSANVFESYIESSNNLAKKQYYQTSDEIARMVRDLYGNVPSTDMELPCPSLIRPAEVDPSIKKRWNPNLHKFEYKVLVSTSRPIKRVTDGWQMLLRYFTESNARYSHLRTNDKPRRCGVGVAELSSLPFSVSSYTQRDVSSLRLCWR